MTASITKASGWKPRPMMVPMGPGTVQGRVYIKPFMPKKSIKILGIQMLAMGQRQTGQEDGVEHDGCGEQQRLVDGKQTGTTAALPTARIS